MLTCSRWQYHFFLGSVNVKFPLLSICVVFWNTNLTKPPFVINSASFSDGHPSENWASREKGNSYLVSSHVHRAILYQNVLPCTSRHTYWHIRNLVCKSRASTTWHPAAWSRPLVWSSTDACDCCYEQIAKSTRRLNTERLEIRSVPQLKSKQDLTDVATELQASQWQPARLVLASGGQGDTARHSETQRDTVRHSETQGDTARHSETQRDTVRERERDEKRIRTDPQSS